MSGNFDRLAGSIKEIQALQSAQAALAWDQETMMPPKGAEGRAESLAALSKVIHQKLTHPALRELLEACAADPGLDDAGKAMVREVAWDAGRAAKVPESLAEEMARAESLSQHAWAAARPKDDTAAFNPWLAKILDLRRREAEHLGYADNPYDALLENFEPGARSADLKAMFAELKGVLVPLLDRLRGKADRPEFDRILSQDFEVEGQKTFNRHVLKAMGFDLEAGRLDESAHPFTQGLHPCDVRLTTRYFRRDLGGSVFSTLHEGGHGLYEQGLPAEHAFTPLAQANSLGVHESQSRLWENQVGRSRPFWDHFFPALRKLFPAQFGAVAAEDFVRAINRVRPSLIRVEADEVTYNLHIILRFELEYALFNRQLEVADLEGAWNEGMGKLLGVVPDRPANGYMQDVHWSAGLMGYFPTYTLGNLYAAQLFHRAQAELPGLEGEIREGRLLGLRDWLRDKVHRHGRRHRGAELIARATGEAPTIRYFASYLDSKYSALFGA